ncbi:hypothetical protein H4S14_003991 [Agrobacterium vitis]|nr:hypothetical protein [Agrobacterium vitis]MBE1440219.1 hypothetical protein [Agrobacterium vitis]
MSKEGVGNIDEHRSTNVRNRKAGDTGNRISGFAEHQAARSSNFFAFASMSRRAS